MSSSSAVISDELSSDVASLARRINAAVDGGDISNVDDAALRQIVGAASRLYATRVEQSGFVPCAETGALTATQGMIVCTALLRAVNVQLFELGLWQSW